MNNTWYRFTEHEMDIIHAYLRATPGASTGAVTDHVAGVIPQPPGRSENTLRHRITALLQGMYVVGVVQREGTRGRPGFSWTWIGGDAYNSCSGSTSRGFEDALS